MSTATRSLKVKNKVSSGGMRASFALAFLVATSPATALAQSGPPIQPLGAAHASLADQFGSSLAIRAFEDGRILVNDPTYRRLLLLDSTLTLIKVVADSASNTMNAYGPRGGRLLAYSGDSSLLIDGASYSMLVIDGQGNIVRVKAIPRAEHATALASYLSSYGYPGFDANGRLIYRTSDPARIMTMAAGGGLLVPEQPDSAPVMRMDLVTRTLDTIAQVKIQKRLTQPYQLASGTMTMRTVTNPMPVQDAWTVTSDGRLALLRHRDYHLDFMDADGQVTSSPPMPFDWQRLTDDNKKAFVDSLRDALEQSRLRMARTYDSINAMCFTVVADSAPGRAADGRGAAADRGAATAVSPPVVAGRGAAVVTGGRGAPPPVSRAAPPGAAPPGPGVASRPTPTCPTAPIVMPSTVMQPNIIPPEALPDYKPPFAANPMRADSDGNVWIRVNQMKPVAGTLLYDIANGQGELIARVQTPLTRTIVGFAPGGIVYLVARDPSGMKLERVRWK
jgi:hypothetical protein